MKAKYADPIFRRMEADALSLDKKYGFSECPYLKPGQPRWKLGKRWIEFECGCVAERCRTLINPKNFDPIIFEGLPEQAVYWKVCDKHMGGPGDEHGMYHSRIRYSGRGAGGYADFNDWFKRRRPFLMGEK